MQRPPRAKKLLGAPSLDAPFTYPMLFGLLRADLSLADRNFLSTDIIDYFKAKSAFSRDHFFRNIL
jgi:hypothetical protein